MYYLQDTRQILGNDLVWWAQDSRGYTTDVSKAHVFTKAQAYNQHRCRETDLPWPKAYIDKRVHPVADSPYVDHQAAVNRGDNLVELEARRK